MKVSQNHVIGSSSSQRDKPAEGCGLESSVAPPNTTGVSWNRSVDSSVPRYSPEHALLLPCTPDEVREEVELLLSDLIVRLKQLLFNSLLCAYYVGFIPVQFADVSCGVGGSEGREGGSEGREGGSEGREGGREGGSEGRE